MEGVGSLCYFVTPKYQASWKSNIIHRIEAILLLLSMLVYFPTTPSSLIVTILLLNENFIPFEGKKNNPKKIKK